MKGEPDGWDGSAVPTGRTRRWSPRSAKGGSLFMGANYHYTRPQLFCCASFRLSSISQRQKSPISSHIHNVWMSFLLLQCRRLVNIRRRCRWIRGWEVALPPVSQLCFIPAAGGRKSTASYEISFLANNPSLIYISPPSRSRPSRPSGRRIFSALLSPPPLLPFISRQQKFYTKFGLFPHLLLTFWWNALAADDRQQIPISRLLPQDRIYRV